MTTDVLYILPSSISHIEPGMSQRFVLRATSHSRSVCGPGTGPLFFFHQSLSSGVTNWASPGTTSSWKTIISTHGNCLRMFRIRSDIFAKVASVSQFTTDICTPAIPNKRLMEFSLCNKMTGSLSGIGFLQDVKRVQHLHKLPALSFPA